MGKNDSRRGVRDKRVHYMLRTVAWFVSQNFHCFLSGTRRDSRGFARKRPTFLYISFFLYISSLFIFEHEPLKVTSPPVVVRRRQSYNFYCLASRITMIMKWANDDSRYLDNSKLHPEHRSVRTRSLQGSMIHRGTTADAIILKKEWDPRLTIACI